MTDHTLNQLKLELPDEGATARLGRALGLATLAMDSEIRRHGLVIYLDGELGAGKTALVRGALRAMGEAGPVKSPTFARLEIYSVSSFNLYHFDLYRLEHPQEFLDAGFNESFGAGSVCAVEWSSKGAGAVPAADLTVTLDILTQGRLASLKASTEQGQQWLLHVRTNLGQAASAR